MESELSIFLPLAETYNLINKREQNLKKRDLYIKKKKIINRINLLKITGSRK